MLRLRTLGELRLTGPAGDLLPGRRKELVLLTYLAQRAPRAVRRAELVDLLWGERDEARARHSLRQALLMLRRTVGAGLMIGSQAVTLASDVVELDLASFDAAVTGSRFREAVELWGGDFLFAAEDVGDEAYRVWLEAERERARRGLRDALERLVAEAAAASDRSSAITWAEWWTEQLPFDEQACYRLVEALYLDGRTVAAQARYQEYTSRLRRQLGVEPSAALVLLGERIAAAEVRDPAALGRVGSATPSTPGRVGRDGPQPEVARPRRRWTKRGLALAGLAAVGVLLLGTVVLRRTVTLRRLPIVAVGPIAEQGGADSLNLSLPVGGLLAVNLARVPGLTAISSARIYEIVGQLGGSPGPVADAARQAGADELIDGVLQRAPDGRLHLDLRRVDLRTGVVRGAYTAVASGPFELVDSATARLAADLGLSAGVGRIADVTTHSVDGYREYEAGLRSLGAGEYEQALQRFQAALVDDSLFAMAAFYSHTTADALGRPASPPLASSLERLDSVAARAPERERLLIRATLASVLQDPIGTTLAESLARRYPAEPEGHLLLGTARIGNGDFLDALPQLRSVITMDSLGLRVGRPRCWACGAFGAMVSAYTLADSFAAAERVTREWIRYQPGAVDPWRMLGWVVAAQGRYDEGVAAVRGAAAASRPDVPGVAVLLPQIVRIQAGDYESADRALGELVRTGRADLRQDALWYLAISLRNQGRLNEAMARMRELARLPGADPGVRALFSAQIHFESGRYREAARIFDSLASFPAPGAVRGLLARHKCWLLIHLATTHAAAGDTAALDALLEPLRAWGMRSSYGRDRRLYHHANGLLLVARGRLAQAADEFRHAMYSPTFGYTRTNYELARTLLALGRPHEAVAVLQAALRGALDGSNLYITRTDLREVLGRAYEAAGEPDSAAAQYRAVLAAWRNADRPFHARRDAIRERLAALGRSPGSTP